MGHLERKLAWCLAKAAREGERHRGLRKALPDAAKAERHLAKAEHNLMTLRLLIREGVFDWAVSASFYTMYHCLLALLAKHGYESRNQECTFAAVESLIQDGKVNLDSGWLRMVAAHDAAGDMPSALLLREEFQYGTGTALASERIQDLLEKTVLFLDLTRDALKR